nr:DEAD-box ATP-dependent RNA helicase 35-like [Tanacetum cinerariifolium]
MLLVYQKICTGHKCPRNKLFIIEVDDEEEMSGEEVHKIIRNYRETIDESFEKDAFKWSDEAQRAFLELKTALSIAPVLTLPDFEKQSGIGKVAYRLDLPSDSQIHPVFHVSLLKLASGQPGKIIPIPTESCFRLQPLKVLDHKMVKMGSRAAMKILVQWKDESAKDATWEYLDELQLRFLDLSDVIALPF